MDPVFSGLADKVLLRTSSRRISLDGVTLGADQIVELGELDHECIVVVLEEGLGFESGGKNRLEMPPRLFLTNISLSNVVPKTFKKSSRSRTYIMLLDNLLKPCVIQLRKLGEIMHIGDDVTQHLL